MISNKKVVVIPAYNEERTIQNTIDIYKKISDIIIINDGSTDKTGLIAKENEIHTITHSKNLGYDKSITSGLDFAKKLNYKYVVTVDADEQHNIDDVINFFNKLDEENYQLIVGVRNKYNRFSEIIFNYFILKLLRVNDLLCGLKGYRIDIIKEFNEFNKKNFIGTFVALKAIRNKKKYTLMPIKIKDRFDKPRFGNSFVSNYKILILLLNIIFMIFNKKI